MKSHTDSTRDHAPTPISSLSVFAARLAWICIGPIVLVFTTYAIVAKGTGWLTRLDAFFGIVVGLMLLGRRVEHRSGSATTAMGEAATDAHFRRYMVGLPLVAAGIWIVANVLGNEVFGRRPV